MIVLILQEGLNINKEKCNIPELYFNGENYFFLGKQLNIEKGGFISTDTYFNSFSISKWAKYSIVEKYGIDIVIKGKCDIFLCYAWIDSDNIIRRWGDNRVFYKKTNSKKETIKLAYPQNNNAVIAYFMIKASEKVCIEKFNYCSVDIYNQRTVNLAIGICTYKRDEYVYRNVKDIAHGCFNNRNIEIIISDNGHTLDEKKLQFKNVSLFNNRNYGGSGGFTRCIIEAKKRKKYTHILLLDDDVLVDCDAIKKTYKLLELLKDEYYESLIGGGLLALGERNKQYESGALFYRGDLFFTQKNVDLTTIRNVIQNELNRDMNYSAWCYCVIPMTVIKDDNLPLPIFIHMDDVEYGVRNNLPIITMNGISLWHPFFVNQRSTHIVYYDVRNKLITMAEFGGIDIRDYAKKYLNIFYKSIFNYDYERTIMACKGIEDFCKGIDYFKTIDALELNNELMKKNQKWVDAEIDETKIIKNSFKRNISRKLLFETYLFPLHSDDNNSSIYSCNIADIFPHGEKRFYLYNPNNGKISEYKKSLIKMLQAKYACKKAERLIEKKLLDVSFEWKDRIHELCTIDFWADYLGLEK